MSIRAYEARISATKPWTNKGLSPTSEDGKSESNEGRPVVWTPKHDRDMPTGAFFFFFFGVKIGAFQFSCFWFLPGIGLIRGKKWHCEKAIPSAQQEKTFLKLPILPRDFHPPWRHELKHWWFWSSTWKKFQNSNGLDHPSTGLGLLFGWSEPLFSCPGVLVVF